MSARCNSFHEFKLWQLKTDTVGFSKMKENFVVFENIAKNKVSLQV